MASPLVRVVACLDICSDDAGSIPVPQRLPKRFTKMLDTKGFGEVRQAIALQNSLCARRHNVTGDEEDVFAQRILVLLEGGAASVIANTEVRYTF